jgi:GDPmannose 4,6-dehydratase
MIKKVLITGVTGQDGSNLVDYLLKNTDVEIIGTVRLLSNRNHINIEQYIDNPRFNIIFMDLTDSMSIINVFRKVMPDYFINFAAQSFVGESWNQPIVTFQTNTMALIYILETIRQEKPDCKFYSAGSSEEFGDVEFSPQTLEHPLKPRSPYGASKCAARHIVKVYRESYGLFAIHCVLFNHEGIRRGENFVTRKITKNMSRIKYEIENNINPKKFELGNIYAKRDWSDSEDFVEAIWIMINREVPKEYILSSNEEHSVKEFVDETIKCLNLDCNWIIDENEPLNTKLMYKNYEIITISEKFYRPAEVDILKGDCINTLNELKWKPKISFKQLVKKMIEHDYQMLLQEKNVNNIFLSDKIKNLNQEISNIKKVLNINY